MQMAQRRAIGVEEMRAGRVEGEADLVVHAMGDVAVGASGVDPLKCGGCVA